MRFAPYLFCLGLASLAQFACSSTETTSTAVVRPELVAVDPDDFLGNVRCGLPDDIDAGDAGALDVDPVTGPTRSYVATLFDVTPATVDGGAPNPGIPLPSSPPTSCLKAVTFANVVTNHRYLAEIDACRELPGQLTPISAGSRLLSNASGTRVPASWVATCGGYRPSPDAGASADAGGASNDARPPGVIAYASITQTPHDCGQGLTGAEPN